MRGLSKDIACLVAVAALLGAAFWVLDWVIDDPSDADRAAEVGRLRESLVQYRHAAEDAAAREFDARADAREARLAADRLRRRVAELELAGGGGADDRIPPLPDR